ncbi:hypothetical protein M3Y95_00984900 [Aphelenchoides besseyi]|nr:hypothetical protein M3Y95_00984900 [Aphelenchoides besseyi]
MSCFPSDVSGREIIQFEDTQSVQDNTWILDVHRILLYAIESAAVLSNLLLVFLFNNYPNFSYGRHIPIMNAHFVFQNRTINQFLIAFIQTGGLMSWIVIAVQFFYRHHLLVHGSQLSGSKLLAFVLIFILSLAISAFASFYFFSSDDVKSINDSISILHQLRYGNIEASRIFVGDTQSSQAQVLNSVYLLVLASTYIVVTYFGVASNRYIRTNSQSNATKKLQKEFSKVMILHAVIPFLTNVAPAFYVSYTVLTCKTMPIVNLLHVIIVQSNTLCNPLLTIFLVRKIRHALFRYLPFVYSNRIQSMTSTMNRLPSSIAVAVN